MFLSEAEGRKLRIGDLAKRLSLSISGIARLVNRLVEEGLVERNRCQEDGRGFNAVLIGRGLERLERAYPAHLASARRHVIDHLAGFDLEELSKAFMRIGEECETTYRADDRSIDLSSYRTTQCRFCHWKLNGFLKIRARPSCPRC